MSFLLSFVISEIWTDSSSEHDQREEVGAVEEGHVTAQGLLTQKMLHFVPKLSKMNR